MKKDSLKGFLRKAYTGMSMGFSLFVDGLPSEMTWDWLMQIFRGVGEIKDVFVS